MAPGLIEARFRLGIEDSKTCEGKEGRFFDYKIELLPSSIRIKVGLLD